jgi:HK97 family phage prohead protease
MQTKSLTIENMDDVGKGLARIATLSAVDSDGDTYAKGAFSWKDGGDQWAPILVAHDRKMMPIGKARVFEDGDAALAELHINLDTQTGKDWHSALKFDLEKGKPVQEWSYGYEVKDFGHKMQSGNRVREIKRTDVHEVSAVVRGAGAGTRTLQMKSVELKENHFAPLIASLGELATALPEDPSALSATGLKQLEEIERAIGGVLSPLRAHAAKERLAVDTAIAGFLKLQSRPHLRS